MDLDKSITIAKLIQDDDQNVAARVAETFDVSRQTASAWLASLRREGLISARGMGRGTQYSLLNTYESRRTYMVTGLSEDRVWRDQCFPVFRDFPGNLSGIWHHGITEMVNNAIEHSGSESISVTIRRNLLHTECEVKDAGEGIFMKIQRALDLFDASESILELAKGKLTTDPAHHSGEGIFFSSRMFDCFEITSGDLSFVRLGNDQGDALLSKEQAVMVGTRIVMRLGNDSKKTTKDVFDQFAFPDEFAFAKTIVPVHLAQHEGEALISRSQARRLTRGCERFHTVVLDFNRVKEIGQAFADEVFRVYATAHPEISLHAVNMTAAVEAMVRRVRNPDGRKRSDTSAS